MDSTATHQWLLDPASYPEPTTGVEFRETHISRVYLTDTRAYKFKKPLNLGFLDFSTLARRRHFCAEELRLNRRFAPAVYLDVVTLRQHGGRLSFGGPGRLLDVAVRMRRLPEERMLDRLLEAGTPGLREEITRLAVSLAPLLAKTEICTGSGPDGDNAASVRANCLENLAQTEPLVGEALSPEGHRLMTAITRRELDRLEPLLRRRQIEGFVRDGHGDLHAANICMTEPVTLYDCIEFSRRFRVADVAAELAFLLMDLDARGRRDLAAHFVAVYLAHAPDPELHVLLPFYKSYRAWVRGKVDALLAATAEAGTAGGAAALTLARRYFNLALGYQLPAALYLTAGLMGVGKTTLARALSTATGAILLRSDEIRKELAGLPSALPNRDRFGSGLYAPEMTERTYAALRERAAQALSAGTPVIVDASFARRRERTAFAALAAAEQRPAYLLHLHCPEETALARLRRRVAEATDASDGRPELYHRQAADFEPMAAGDAVIDIDTAHPVDYNVQMILCHLLRGR